MGLDDLALFGGERARLEQDRVGDRELADVMQGSGPAHASDRLGRKSQPGGEQRRRVADALRVLVGVVIAVLRGQRQPLNHLQASVIELMRALLDPVLQVVSVRLELELKLSQLEEVRDAQTHLLGIKWLGQEVARAERQRLVLGLVAHVGGEHDNRARAGECRASSARAAASRQSR